MEEGSRLLIIGLDGATFDVLGPLAEQGVMPNLAALMDRGSWGRLASTVPPFTAAAWSSFITGRNPGGHGVISFRKRDRFNYDREGSGFVDARRFGTTLWDLLGKGGKRVGVVNVPLTFPARPVNGFMVTGMLTPPGAQDFTYPPGLAQQLGAGYVIDVDFIRDQGSFRMAGFPPKPQMLAQVRHMLDVRAAVCSRLLQEEAWDFFMVVFTSTDRILHFFWDDLSAWMQAGEPLSALQHELRAFFVRLDDALGELRSAAGPSATVMVISDHGFGPAPTRRFYLNVWLEQMGLLNRRGAQGIADLEHWRVLVGRNKLVKTALRKLLPQSTQDSLTRAAVSRSGEILDWGKTQAYYVPIYFQVCGVEINLRGARRDGFVDPGEPYETLCRRIIDAARRLTDPETGAPIVVTAARCEDLYHGPFVEEFPDVILVLDPDYIGASSLAGTSLVEPHPDPMRPGEHRQDGIFAAAGPAVRAQGELSGLSLVDIPGTALYTLGLPIPAFFDGRPLLEVFEPAYVDAHPVTIHDVAPAQAEEESGAQGFSTEDEAALEERLRGLGYLD